MPTPVWHTSRSLSSRDSRSSSPMETGRSFNEQEWVSQASDHGFSDFNHVLRPNKKGVGVHYRGKAAEAVTVIEAERNMTAKFRLAWDDQLILRVDSERPIDLGTNAAFK